MLNVPPEVGLSKLVCGLCTVWYVSFFLFKVSSFCFTYFHLKHTSHSLSPLCAAPLNTTPLPEAVSFSSWLKSKNSHVTRKFQPPLNAHINLKICTALHPKSSFISIQCMGTAGVSVVYNVMAQLAKIIKCSLHLFT